MLIYKITNKLNGKSYIGQTTVSIETRVKAHMRKSACHGIYRAIQKYGIENFTVEQIDTATTQEELNIKEEKWISYYILII